MDRTRCSGKHCSHLVILSIRTNRVLQSPRREVFFDNLQHAHFQLLLCVYFCVYALQPGGSFCTQGTRRACQCSDPMWVLLHLWNHNKDFRNVILIEVKVQHADYYTCSKFHFVKRPYQILNTYRKLAYKNVLKKLKLLRPSLPELLL